MLLKDDYRSRDYLADYSGTLLILRGRRDSVIPEANTARLLTSLRHTQPREVVIGEADHDSIGLSPEYAQALRNFLREE